MTREELLLVLGERPEGPTTVYKVRKIAQNVSKAYEWGDPVLLAEWVSVFYLTVQALNQNTASWMVDYHDTMVRLKIDISLGEKWPDRVLEMGWEPAESAPERVESLPYLSGLLDDPWVNPLREFTRFF